MEVWPRALDRGLRLIRHLAQHPDGQRFSDIQRALNIPENSLARLLTGLIANHYLDHHLDVYTLGPTAAALSRPLRPLEQLRLSGERIAQDLSDSTRNTVLIIGWDGTYMHCLARIRHPDSTPLQQPGHTAKNWRNTPWGWFFKGAAYWKAAGNLDGGGGANQQNIISELTRLKRHGYCYDLQRDRRRLAAPILINRHVRGALVVGGTAISLHNDDIASIGLHLAQHARHLQRMLQA